MNTITSQNKHLLNFVFGYISLDLHIFSLMDFLNVWFTTKFGSNHSFQFLFTPWASVSLMIAYLSFLPTFTTDWCNERWLSLLASPTCNYQFSKHPSYQIVRTLPYSEGGNWEEGIIVMELSFSNGICTGGPSGMAIGATQGDLGFKDICALITAQAVLIYGLWAWERRRLVVWVGEE
jgi:hypothetical protein